MQLEGRFEFLRTEETNLSNMIADIFYTEYANTDLVLLNSGTLRSNSVWQAGPITMK